MRDREHILIQTRHLLVRLARFSNVSQVCLIFHSVLPLSVAKLRLSNGQSEQ